MRQLAWSRPLRSAVATPGLIERWKTELTSWRFSQYSRGAAGDRSTFLVEAVGKAAQVQFFHEARVEVVLKVV